ncbi:peptidoglycan-binding protein [Clostridium butyricum]|uniref:L,D-transpeptidase family protein n=1 Tax=Clostridium butyricum TaxID=1492 RepID=UPI000F52B101|nr:L,D-transpeptidase family protein [Clostridium butyricum]RQN12793.1 peptidoglycan-binding protein [Clostridium butyricum]
MRRHRKDNSKKVAKIMVMSLCPLIAMYLGISAYFMNHFYFGSTIYDVNVSGKTVKQAEALLADEISGYTLKLQGRNDVSEEIKGTDIALEYEQGDKIENFKKSQNPFLWIASLFTKNEFTNEQLVTFDKDLLKDKIDNSSFFDKENIIEPKNPTFEYGDDGFNIVTEVKGSKIDEEVLVNKVSEAVKDGNTVIDLNELGCYVEPKYTENSPEVNEAKKSLDKIADSKITYTFGSRSEVLDGSTISKWLNVDDNMEVTVDENHARQYVESLARNYNTYSNTRDFTTSTNKKIQVSGGNYGWIINKPEETKQLIEVIKQGEKVTREPVYSQEAISREKDDVGNTYVELDMTKQHIWFYKNGALIVEGDVVTGNAANNWSTPVGTYRLNYKERNATLKGEDYESKVNYWLPFNNNIGIHDAGWRTEFGGQIYLTNGSHGCVNAPYEVAEKIFQNIEAGTPIICYYE